MIDNTKEYIACSAIHYNNHIHYKFMDGYGISEGFVLCGFRHMNIISVLPTNVKYKDTANKASQLGVDWGEEIQPNITQGFMTSKGRFVDRYEAAKIAFVAGQIDSEVKTLYSEDIFE